MNESIKKEYKIDKEESNCIYIVKLIFAIMVICIHAYVENINFSTGNIVVELPIWLESIRYIISRIIAWCSVPGFILLSSILLYKREFDWKENMKKKVKSLLIPYLTLNLFWIIFYALAQKILFLQQFFSNEEYVISNWNFIDFLDAFLGFKTGYPILYPLWFIRDLFLINIFSKIIVKAVDKFPKTILLIITLMYLLPISFLSLDMIVFFILGYYLVKYDFHTISIKKIKMIYLLLPYAIGIIIAYFMKNLFLSYLINRLLSILGIIVFIRIAFSIHSNFIIYISKYSLFIFYFHESYLTIIRKLLFKLFPKTPLFVGGVEYLLSQIIILIFCILLAILIEKKIPILYKVLTGKYGETKENKSISN